MCSCIQVPLWINDGTVIHYQTFIIVWKDKTPHWVKSPNLFFMSSQRRQSSMRPGSLFFSLKLWSGGSPVGRIWSVFSKRLFLVLDWILTFLLIISGQWKENQARRRSCQWGVSNKSQQPPARGWGCGVCGEERGPRGGRRRGASICLGWVFFTEALRFGLVVLLLLRHALSAEKSTLSGRHRFSGFYRNSGARSHLPATGWAPTGYAQWLGCTKCTGTDSNIHLFLFWKPFI